MTKNSFIQSIKKIYTLALPMAGSQFLNVSSGFLCMAMVATLGSQVLAASALIFTTQLSIMVTGMAILFSVSVLVGHAFGAGNYLAIGNYLQQSWTLSILIGLPIMVFFWHIDSILLLLGQSKAITEIVKIYFHSFAWAVIPGMLSTANMQFGYGINKKKLMFSISCVSVSVLLISAYALIYGKWGMPKMGIRGLAIATCIQYTSYFTLSTLIFFFEKSFAKFELSRYRVHQHWEYLVQMLKIGWPICVQMGGEMLSFFVSGIMVGWLGMNALASFQIVNQYYFLVIIPIFALSQASGILVGYASGAKQLHEVKKLSFASIVLACCLSVIVLLIFLIFPKQLAAFYLDINNPSNYKILELTIVLFIVIAVSQFCDAVRNILIGNLRGLFDTRFPMIITILSIWVIGMPLSYLLAFVWNFGIIGFAVGGLLGMFSGAVIMGFRLYRKLKTISPPLKKGE